MVLLGPAQGEGGGGLLWAELGLGEGLGEREGLQLPGGAPPPLLPLAPWPSRPSEFSSISWMRGGMEPGISIFSVITRSAPEGGGEGEKGGRRGVRKVWLRGGGRDLNN